MEFIKIIAPWLPVLAVVYILIKCRYFILALYYAIKRRVTGRVLSVPVSNEQPAVAVPATTVGSKYHELMGYKTLDIFSICLSNTETKYKDVEQRVRLNNEQMNKAFAELMSANRKIED
jgi:hypothetical protein